MDVTKFTDQQREIAIKIADEARAAGVDPELALAVGWAENQFNPAGRSPKGAVGPMQVMPSNARGLGIDPKDLLDPDKNIKAGIAILKENLQRFNDPTAALVGYNANPKIAGKFLETGDRNLLPKETRDYIDRVSELTRLAVSSPFGELAPPPEEPTGEGLKELPESYQMARRFMFGEGEIRPTNAAMAGSILGGTVGTGERLYDIFHKRAAAGAADKVGVGGTSGEKWLKNWAGIERTVPGGVPEGAQTYERIKTHGKGAGEKLWKMYGNKPLDITRQAESAALERELAEKAARSEAMKKVSKFLGRIPGGSVLAGGMAGKDIAEAMQRYEEGDVSGALINAVGGLGSAAALVPHTGIRLFGGALSLASMPAEYINDLLKGKIKAPQSDQSEYAAP